MKRPCASRAAPLLLLALAAAAWTPTAAQAGSSGAVRGLGPAGRQATACPRRGAGRARRRQSAVGPPALLLLPQVQRPASEPASKGLACFRGFVNWREGPPGLPCPTPWDALRACTCAWQLEPGRACLQTAVDFYSTVPNATRTEAEQRM